MRRFSGFSGFAREHERDLLTTAFLLTGSQTTADRLTRQALRAVGSAWPPNLWSDPVLHARLAIYRGFLATSGLPYGEREKLVIAVARLRDGTPPERLAPLLELTAAAIEERVATLPPLPSVQLPQPDLADGALRSVRLSWLRGRIVAAALILLVAWPAWEYLRTPSAALSLPVPDRYLEGTVKAAPVAVPKAWKIPRTDYTIRYAVPVVCGGGPATQPEPGTIACAGWTLSLGARRGVSNGDVGTHVCLNDDCRSGTPIPDAASLIASGSDSYFDVEPVIGQDGRRVAYLSAAEHRFVAVDLRTRAKIYLTPELAAKELKQRSRVTASADSRYFTVSVGTASTRTDFTTGTTTPARQETAIASKKHYDDSASSPDGRFVAGIDDERGENGTLDVVDGRTGRVLRSVKLPTIGASASQSRLRSWLDGDEVAIRMESEGDVLGWYAVNASTGTLTRIPRLPGDDRLVLGKP